MQDHENHILNHDGRPAQFVADLYSLVPQSPKDSADAKVAIKDPIFFTANYLENYHDYFPSTKMVLGLRHPVSWFQRYVRDGMLSEVVLLLSFPTYNS